MSNVQQTFSPCGQRIVMVDRHSGDVWLCRRLPPAEGRDALAMVARWEDQKKPATLVPVPKARASRKKKSIPAVLSLM